MMTSDGELKPCKHVFDEFHMYEVVCSKCKTCREYTKEDEVNLERHIIAIRQKLRAEL